MSNPVEITVGSKNEGSKNVSHEYYISPGRDRYQALKRLADANPDIFSVISVEQNVIHKRLLKN